MNAAYNLLGSNGIKTDLTDLFRSNGVEKLKGRSMYAGYHLLHRRITTTRFEHSIGTAQLSEMFQLPEDMVRYALVHEIQHLALSPALDLVAMDPQWRTDRNYEDLTIARSGCRDDFVNNHRTQNIINLPLPSLNLDRLDYTLRASKDLRLVDEGDIEKILDSISFVEGTIFFHDERMARYFRYLFEECDNRIWSSPDYLITTHYLGKILSHSLRKGEITEDDLIGSDRDLLDKLRYSDDERTKRNMKVTDNISGVVSDKKGILATPKNRLLVLKTIDGLAIKYEPKHKAYKSSLTTSNGKTIRGLI